MQNDKILFVTSEAAPLVKTGGLGDVGGSLPTALKALKCDIRIVLPAYREVLRIAGKLAMVGLIDVSNSSVVRILEGKLPNTHVTVWFIDSPAHFDRPGGLYAGPDGHDWHDNAERFTVFAKAAELIALNQAGLNWYPDIVHCNDWQSALVPALLAHQPRRPASVFTIHNLAYQGLFPAETFERLRVDFQLPPDLWDIHSMEFHGLFSFVKGGLVYSDMLNTVSPTYSHEIRTPAFGNGLDGLLVHRAERLVGILNGADYAVWNPATDPFIAKNYSADKFGGKASNKTALQERFGLPVKPDTPLIGMVGRLVEQKGGDLVLQVIPNIIGEYDVQFIVLGTGDKRFELAFTQIAANHPDKIAVHIGFSEELAHTIESGADMFLMPSRFEPCGLNQMYSLRYGTIPIVRHTGGLADTVIDATDESLDADTANGFSFDIAAPQALRATVERALHLYRQPQLWSQIAKRAMAADYSWSRSARAYIDLYELARQYRNTDKPYR